MATGSTEKTLPRATVLETIGVLTEVFAPNVAKGVIIRRPKMVAAAERMHLDQRAVQRMQQLRDRYGEGPLLLQLPFREQAVILDAAHVRRVLEQSPEPFATASSEKRAALRHFEPKGALISHGPERAERRRFNEEVLESGNPMHHLTESFLRVVDEEAAHLLREVEQNGRELTWDAYIEAWFRVVRRVVFGDSARDDYELRELINSLRQDANWALKPVRKDVRSRFLARVNRHLQRAEPGSLASVIAAVPKSEVTAPDHQVPQWLFAFDPAGMTSFRALALLTTHPRQAEAARQEIRASRESGNRRLTYLRACVLESLRLWPTTPMILRQSTEETTWENGTMPENTGVLIFAPFFHRDEERLPFAHRFSPEVWLQSGKADEGSPPWDWPLVPFSDGNGLCPGRTLVLLLTTNMLAAILDERKIWLRPAGRLDESRPLPATLDNYSLRFLIGSRNVNAAADPAAGEG